MSKSIKDAAYYMSLNYEKTLTAVPQDEGGGYIAAVPLLGTSSTNAWGETEAEALETLKTVMRNNFESWIAGKYPIPEPEAKAKRYSGKYLLRMSPYVHAQAEAMAAEQNISLNQFLCNAVCEYIGKACML